MNIHSLFPTPLAQVNLNRKLTDSEYQAIINQPFKTDMVNKISDNLKMLDIPELSQIKAFCEYYTTEFWERAYVPQAGLKLNITLSWANYLEKGEWCNMHNHSNSIISGVFYVQTESDDAIMFHKSQEYQRLAWLNQHDTPWNAEGAMFPAVEGDLLLFPSSLTHRIIPVMHDKVRISLSFNSWLSGTLGGDLGELTL